MLRKDDIFKVALTKYPIRGLNEIIELESWEKCHELTFLNLYQQLHRLKNHTNDSYPANL